MKLIDYAKAVYFMEDVAVFDYYIVKDTCVKIKRSSYSYAGTIEVNHKIKPNTLFIPVGALDTPPFIGKYRLLLNEN